EGAGTALADVGSGRVSDLGHRGVVVNRDFVPTARMAVKLDRDSLASPGCQDVIELPGLPGVVVLRAVVEGAVPVPLGDVAGAGEQKDIVRCTAVAEDPLQRFVNAAAALAVAPVGHDEGTGDDLRAFLPRPLHRFEKLLGAVGLP